VVDLRLSRPDLAERGCPSDRRRRLHRRQFILASTIKLEFAGWKAFPIAGGQFVARVHPDLGAIQRSRDGLELTLLGYLTAPDTPAATNEQIVDQLLSQASGVMDIFPLVETLGGRWVLIVADGKTVWLLHDAAGLRQVHYTDSTLPTPICASQPGLIARELGLPPDREAVESILTPEAVAESEYWWPGDSSPYAGVRRLLPNHCLDLTARRVFRYWPSRPRTCTPLNDAVAQTCESLRRMIVAGAARFDLALGLSAGLDSRIILAASREIRHRLQYYSIRFPSNSGNHPDLTVPARLVESLGLTNHHWLPCSDQVRTEYRDLHFESVAFARPQHGSTGQAFEDHFPRQCVAMLGHCSEVGRSFYRRRGTVREPLDGSVLARLTFMGVNAFAARHFGAWLEEAEPVAKACGYDVLDLFYWEQRCGSWLAMGYQELDLAREVFVPFNCRDLLAKLLAVDARYRGGDDLMHREMIRHAWPELLTVPINPPAPVPFARRMRDVGGNILRRLGVLDAIRRALPIVESIGQSRGGPTGA
jgi:hypothetical protein